METVYCSYYTNFRDVSPTLISLEDFVTDQSAENIIARLRETTDESEYRALKMRLPFVTASGVCEGSHANFRKHNGNVCIDIDSKHNSHITDWIALIMYLKLVPEIWYCGLSAGGKGCFLLIKIKYPAKHEEHFRNIERFFRDRLDIVIDPQCINVNRLRFQSFNTPETSWFNPNATTWNSRVRIEPRAAHAVQLPNTETASRVMRCIGLITDNEIDITAGNNWVAIGRAFINEFGEGGRELFHAVSRFHIDYNPQETDKKYTYWQKQHYPYTIRTFFHICKGFGVTFQAA